MAWPFLHPPAARTVALMDPGGSDAPGRGAGDRPDSGVRTGITERNGIWVLTVGGVWRGDYCTREQAEDAAASTQQARR